MPRNPTPSCPICSDLDASHCLCAVAVSGRRKLRVLSLFAGIGGFDLGLERTGGFETVAFCEIDPRARKVLARHWPKVPIYDDVRELSAKRLAADGIAPNVICAGFPCQDVSLAGKRAGIADGTRSGLWSEVARLGGELDADYILLENVTNLLAGPDEQPGAWFGRVLGDLAALGYHAEWRCIPASYIGAWHRRDRVWVLAYSDRIVRQQGLAEKPILRQSDVHVQSTRSFAGWPGRSDLPEPRTCGAADGVPARLHALGNAVVPQIPELIGNAILASLTGARQHAAVLASGAGEMTFHERLNTSERERDHG
jgi:DNA (cytosine-5)-methyltransferase 1